MQQHIPVVLIHKFNVKPHKTDYAAHAINQSLFFNNATFSITDYTPDTKSNELHVNLPFEEYITEEYLSFYHNYEHMSTNPVEFEKACFLRFFILKEFMQRNNFNKIFHIDSDVLLYTTIEDHVQRFNTDFTLSNSQHIANSFLSLNFVQDFCKKIHEVYTKKEDHFWFRDMKKIYNRMSLEGRPGGIVDMSYLEQYKKRNECNELKLTCGEMTEIKDDRVFDFSMKHNKGGFQMKDGVKNITFVDKIPFCYNEELQKNVQFLSLHFLGNTKEILHNYVTYFV